MWKNTRNAFYKTRAARIILAQKEQLIVARVRWQKQTRCVYILRSKCEKNTRNAFYKTRAAPNSCSKGNIDRKGTSPSARIERIVKPSAPVTITKRSLFFLSPPNEMQYTIRELYSTERKGFTPSVRIERTEYAFNGSIQCGCIGQPPVSVV